MYGAAGLVRRRALLLWVATDMARGIDKHEMLRLAIKGTEPPEDEGHLTTHQVGWLSEHVGDRVVGWPGQTCG